MLTFFNSQIASTNRSLVKLWATLYLPDGSAFTESTLSASALIANASDSGRKATADKLQRFLKLHCELAGVETHALFSTSNNVVNLAEVRRLAQFVYQVYLSLSEMHQQQLFSDLSLVLDSRSNNPAQLAQQSDISLPAIDQFAAEITPLIAELRAQHLASKDPTAIGFVTTQFHFTTRSLFKNLSPIEQFMIEPYFRFAEEQVCIPWQQVCEAASQHTADAEKVTVVKQFLPLSNEIAKTVYQRSLKTFPGYQSRRGALNLPVIQASVQRDLKMFQAYFWLSVLEGNLNTVQTQLLPACLMVFPTVNVSWQLVDQMLTLLLREIQGRMSYEQWIVVEPIARSLSEIFSVSAHDA